LVPWWADAPKQCRIYKDAHKWLWVSSYRQNVVLVERSVWPICQPIYEVRCRVWVSLSAEATVQYCRASAV